MLAASLHLGRSSSLTAESVCMRIRLMRSLASWTKLQNEHSDKPAWPLLSVLNGASVVCEDVFDFLSLEGKYLDSQYVPFLL